MKNRFAIILVLILLMLFASLTVIYFLPVNLTCDISNMCPDYKITMNSKGLLEVNGVKKQLNKIDLLEIKLTILAIKPFEEHHIVLTDWIDVNLKINEKRYDFYFGLTYDDNLTRLIQKLIKYSPVPVLDDQGEVILPHARDEFWIVT